MSCLNNNSDFVKLIRYVYINPVLYYTVVYAGILNCFFVTISGPPFNLDLKKLFLLSRGVRVKRLNLNTAKKNNTRNLRVKEGYRRWNISFQSMTRIKNWIFGKLRLFNWTKNMFLTFLEVKAIRTFILSENEIAREYFVWIVSYVSSMHACNPYLQSALLFTISKQSQIFAQNELSMP